MPRRAPIDRYTGPKVKGIDVSHHNGVLNFQQVATDASIRFCIVRTGDIGARLGPRDQQLDRNWRGVAEAGIRRGSYQYFRAAYGGAHQADLMLQQLDDAGGHLASDLPPAIDIEEAGQVTRDDVPLEPQQVLDETQAWLERMESQLGVVPIIYTGQYWHWKISQRGLGGFAARYPLWIPSYGSANPLMPTDPRGGPGPWPTWTIWQYSANGRIPGSPRDTDFNYFRGDEAALARFVEDSKSGSHPLDSLTPFASAFRRWVK